MGLDMYLYLEKYESEYEVKYEEREKLRNKIMERLYPDEMLPLMKSMDEKRKITLSRIARYEVGYWRKANAIHNWIIQNCTTDGTDDCKPIYIDTSDAEKLRDICNEVLKDRSKASEFLPTTDGFFFGGTEYDDGYMEDVRYTAELLSEILNFIHSTTKDPINSKKSYYIVYEASW